MYAFSFFKKFVNTIFVVRFFDVPYVLKGAVYFRVFSKTRAFVDVHVTCQKKIATFEKKLKERSF